MSKNDFHNSEYWEERIANETWKTYNNAEDKNRALMDMYSKTSNAIKKELYAIAEEAEVNGGLSRTQQYRFNKLLGQQGVIFQEIEKLGEKVNKHGTSQMYNAGMGVYENIMKEVGIGDFSLPSKKQMEQMMRRPWHGSFFSERLWNDMGKLERNLNGVINDGIATGKTVTEMAIQLANIMNKDFNYAHNLVRTETINYMNRSALKGYRDTGIKKVQWWAAEDERRCDTCGANHSKTFDIDKAPILPCHPGCRCTWIPVIDEEVTLVSKLTLEEEGALIKYISPDSYLLNDKLRNGMPLSGDDKQWIVNLDAALDKMPQVEGIVQRSLEFMFEEDMNDFLNYHEVGKRLNYSQYVSSSLGKVYNDKGKVQLVIFSKTGRDLRSLNSQEQEVLFKRDVEFTVASIDIQKNCTFIYLSEENI